MLRQIQDYAKGVRFKQGFVVLGGGIPSSQAGAWEGLCPQKILNP